MVEQHFHSPLFSLPFSRSGEVKLERVEGGVGRQSLVRVFYKHTETFAIILHLHNIKCYVHYIYKQKNALGLQGKLWYKLRVVSYGTLAAF